MVRYSGYALAATFALALTVWGQKTAPKSEPAKPAAPAEIWTKTPAALAVKVSDRHFGIGADGLSSSAYGPAEAFIALGPHSQLALYLAFATAFTVFVISLAYNQVIELFPNGGGGYKVATRLVGAYAGLVAGAALVVDYVLTIAISVAISGFVALTLTPALCGVLIRHTIPPQRGFFAWFNRQFDALTQAFGRLVVLVIRRMAIAFLFLVVFVGLIVTFFKVLPTSFVPNEDQGYVMAAILMPDAASLDRTDAVTSRVDAIFGETAGVADRSAFTGYSLLDSGMKTNAGTLFVMLKPYDERYASIAKAKAENAGTVLRSVYAKGREIKEGLVIPVAPPAIPGIGTTGGFEFWIQDTGAGEPAQLDSVTQQFLAKARSRAELSGLSCTFRSSSQQLRANVDRDKATLLGVPVQDVYSAIQAQFGSMTVSQFNDYSRVWWVILQSDPNDIRDALATEGQAYVPLETVKFYTFEQARRVAALAPGAFVLEPKYVREYPDGSLAAPILGSVRAARQGVQPAVDLYASQPSEKGNGQAAGGLALVELQHFRAAKGARGRVPHPKVMTV